MEDLLLSSVAAEGQLLYSAAKVSEKLRGPERFIYRRLRGITQSIPTGEAVAVLQRTEKPLEWRVMALILSGMGVN